MENPKFTKVARRYTKKSKTNSKCFLPLLVRTAEGGCATLARDDRNPLLVFRYLFLERSKAKTFTRRSQRLHEGTRRKTKATATRSINHFSKCQALRKRSQRLL